MKAATSGCRGRPASAPTCGWKRVARRNGWPRQLDALDPGVRRVGRDHHARGLEPGDVRGRQPEVAEVEAGEGCGAADRRQSRARDAGDLALLAHERAREGRDQRVLGPGVGVRVGRRQPGAPRQRDRQVLEAAAGAEQRRAVLDRAIERRQHRVVVLVGSTRRDPDRVGGGRLRGARAGEPGRLGPGRHAGELRVELAVGDEPRVAVAEHGDRGHLPQPTAAPPISGAWHPSKGSDWLPGGRTAVHARR